jgi:hypothetical protein
MRLALPGDVEPWRPLDSASKRTRLKADAVGIHSIRHKAA